MLTYQAVLRPDTRVRGMTNLNSSLLQWLANAPPPTGEKAKFHDCNKNHNP